MPKQPPSTSILILNHNACDRLRQCLLSIQVFTDVPYELIIIDNGSVDGSVDFLREADLPNLTLVENETNIGCPPARAQGMTLAHGDFVLFLDNDTILTPGWLQRLLAHCHRDPTIGLIGPTTNYASGGQMRDDIRYHSTAALATAALKVASDNPGRRAPTDRLVGFCMLISRAVIDKIGCCDARFGKYGFEDDDYTRRALIAGFGAYIAHDVFIHHTGNSGRTGDAGDYPALVEQAWQVFREKWGFSDALTHVGYANDPDRYAADRSFSAHDDYIPLPDPTSVEPLVTRRT